MRAVILAGGLGTRMAGLYPGLPKPLIPVGGKPVLTRQIETLVRQGITEITLVTGHMADRVAAVFGDGSAYGAHIAYFAEETPLGTAGALYRMDLDGDFLLLSGDLVFDFDVSAMLAFHKEKNALATLFAHPNAHPADSTLIEADAAQILRRFLPKENRVGDFENLANAGVQILSPALLALYPQRGKADLDRDVLRPAAATGRVYVYRSFEYVRDMGTPERLAAVERDLAAGLVAAKNKARPQRAVFLDRDGTLNTPNGFITTPEALTLLPGAAEAVKKINGSGFLAVLVTNQPVIARGECTEATLKEIHNRLETLMGAEGAYLDAIYYCPHHPDAGYPGEVKALKIPCDCRKPAPGMLLRAARELHIDLAASYMVGDSWRDVKTAENAGCMPVYLGPALPDTAPANTLLFPDLKAFADTL